MKLIALDPSLASRPDCSSGVGQRCKLLADRSLDELSPADIAFCLRQSIAVQHVAPLAIEFISGSPLIRVEHYPGDLLLSLLHAAQNNLLLSTQLRELRDACSHAIADSQAITKSVVPAAQAFVGTYDGL